jgi:hypothetical protein
MDEQTAQTTEAIELTDSHSWPTYCRFLKRLCDDANVLAQDQEMGVVNSRVIKRHESLYYVEVNFVDKEPDPDIEDHETFRLFAAGKFDHKNRVWSMIKFERADQPYNANPKVFSSDEDTLLRIISF